MPIGGGSGGGGGGGICVRKWRVGSMLSKPMLSKVPSRFSLYYVDACIFAWILIHVISIHTNAKARL